MGFGRGNLSETAQEIQSFIYDTNMYSGTNLEPLKGNAAWWAEQVGTDPTDTRSALDELVTQNTLIKDDETDDPTYIYTSVTTISPELHGESE